jgi:hypothetical protein
MAPRVPESHLDALKTLRKIPPHQAIEIARRLAEKGPGLHPQRYAPILVEVAGIDEQESTRLLRALTGMYLAHLQENVTLEEYAQAIAREYLADEEGGADQLANSIVTLLGQHDSLGVSAKALALRFSGIHTLCGTPRLITDIRPVFQEREPLKLKATLLLHSLVLSYHVGEQVHELTLTLDDSDLDSLRKILDRARIKTPLLQEYLSNASIPLLEEDK